MKQAAVNRLGRAIRDDLPVTVVYQDKGGARTIRRIQVRHVDYQRGLLHVRCSKHKGQVRTFLIESIQHVFPIRESRRAA